MKEKFDPYEINTTPEDFNGIPDPLDIVKIDGRWAQVRHGGNDLLYLDDRSTEHINWKDFLLIQKLHKSVQTLKWMGEIFTDQEIKNIHWGPEQDNIPELKEMVTVCGKFQRKKRKGTEFSC